MLPRQSVVSMADYQEFGKPGCAIWARKPIFPELFWNNLDESIHLCSGVLTRCRPSRALPIPGHRELVGPLSLLNSDQTIDYEAISINA
jgi:hypothetical protein